MRYLNDTQVESAARKEVNRECKWTIEQIKKERYTAVEEYQY